jgi:glycopeptide antibiotics resistance protein
LVLLIGYGAGAAVVLLMPFGSVPAAGAGRLAHLLASTGAPTWVVSNGHFQFACNALIVMPISALGSVRWRRTTWQDWTAYVFLAACGVELTQALLLPEREPAFTDVVANTLGGFAGAVIVVVVRAVRRTFTDRRSTS